jgi:protein O-GlcNAc transferase
MDTDRSPGTNRLDDAMAYHRAGNLAAAAAGYDAVLAQDPANFDALHLLGLITLQSGDPDRAIILLQRAVDVQPEAYPAIHQLGAAFLASGQAKEAEVELLRAAQIAPEYAPVHETLARFFHEQGQLENAASEFEVVARLLPDSAAAHGNLGTALGQLNRHGEAIDCYQRALAIEPHNAVTLFNAATVLVLLNRPLEAIEHCRTLLTLPLPDANAWYQLGLLCYAQGMRVEAQSAFESALLRDPQHAESLWALTIAELPLAYGPGETPTVFRRRFADAIDRLDAWFNADRTPLGPRAVANQQPFYLAFHEVDNVALLTRYGDLCVRLMHSSQPKPAPRSRRSFWRRPTRVAIASKFFYDQSVWTALARGWCSHFDRRRIEVHLLHTGTISDAETAVARSQVNGFQMGLTSFSQWVKAIETLKPDVLLYPEIGMDAMCGKLASMRLAPAQVVSWGHPETTGLPTIDYYLSAELFEPPNASSHYREELVALPNLGTHYEQLSPPAARPHWDALGIDPGVPRLICAGTPYKYFPEHDHILVEIAQRLGRCQFLFFEDVAPLLSRQIKTRLESAFRSGGLEAADFVRFLPRQSRPAFFGLMRECDVYLDTIGFSGFNTAMQAVECGLPIVTLEGKFMRGRLASGVLRRMGMDELAVQDAELYVETAVRLGQDLGYRSDVRRRVSARRGVLFRDIAPVRALEDFLVSIGRNR